MTANYKIVYSFDKDGIFCGIAKAYRSPLEKDVFHLPINSTEEKPVFQEDSVAKFYNNKWILEKIKQKVVTTLSDAELLENAKEIKKAEIDKRRDQLLNKPVLFKKDGKTHSLSINLSNRISWLGNGNKYLATPWVTDGNEIIEITRPEFKLLTRNSCEDETREVIQARKSKDILLKLETLKEVEDHDIEKIILEK